jgi:hypothetical protein
MTIVCVYVVLGSFIKNCKMPLSFSEELHAILEMQHRATFLPSKVMRKLEAHKASRATPESKFKIALHTAVRLVRKWRKLPHESNQDLRLILHWEHVEHVLDQTTSEFG